VHVVDALDGDRVESAKKKNTQTLRRRVKPVPIERKQT